MKFFILFLGLLAFFLISYSQKKKANSGHKTKPQNTIDNPVSNEFISELINSNYAKSLDSLNQHVANHTVINSATGNAGFILYLDNNSWALAYRINDIISSEFGNDPIPEESIDKINSTKLGNASDISIDNIPFANKINIASNEVKKSHGKLIQCLSIGNNTFNFAFENGMELEFQLCNDKNNIPSIRVFWEQW